MLVLQNSTIREKSSSADRVRGGSFVVSSISQIPNRLGKGPQPFVIVLAGVPSRNHFLLRLLVGSLGSNLVRNAGPRFLTQEEHNAKSERKKRRKGILFLPRQGSIFRISIENATTLRLATLACVPRITFEVRSEDPTTSSPDPHRRVYPIVNRVGKDRRMRMSPSFAEHRDESVRSNATILEPRDPGKRRERNPGS